MKKNSDYNFSLWESDFFEWYLYKEAKGLTSKSVETYPLKWFLSVAPQ